MEIVVTELMGPAIHILLGNSVVANVLLGKSASNDGDWIAMTAGRGFAGSGAVCSPGGSRGGPVNLAVTQGFATKTLFQTPNY